jgi:hypothetical protein
VTFSGKDFNVRASIKYAVEPKLGLWLPLEMVLQSDIRGPGPGGVSNMGAGGNIGMRQTLEGRVLYSRFRQVQIQP